MGWWPVGELWLATAARAQGCAHEAPPSPPQSLRNFAEVRDFAHSEPPCPAHSAGNNKHRSAGWSCINRTAAWRRPEEDTQHPFDLRGRSRGLYYTIDVMPLWASRRTPFSPLSDMAWPATSVIPPVTVRTDTMNSRCARRRALLPRSRVHAIPDLVERAELVLWHSREIGVRAQLLPVAKPSSCSEAFTVHSSRSPAWLSVSWNPAWTSCFAVMPVLWDKVLWYFGGWMWMVRFPCCCLC